MLKITIHTDKTDSQVLIDESHKNLRNYLPPDKKIIIITDTNIRRYYGDFLAQYQVIETGTGEKIKTLQTLAYIYEKLLHYNADRNSYIVAVGGGIVCDITGFAASTYMRGLPFGFISTTLLSQVDASVGGKNGVNFGGFKNMIGTFNQPEFVICDTEMIQTLPESEFINGFAEIIKAATIRDQNLFSYLENNTGKALVRDRDVIRHLVTETIKIKAYIVENDTYELGERRILNFGHTFGHAIETSTGISHGEAVSIGMVIASKLSVRYCDLSRDEATRIENLLANFGLPVNTDADPEEIFQKLIMDKKRENRYIHLVLLKTIGKTKIHKFPISEIKIQIADLLKQSTEM